jgi:hypothetical protein
MDKKLINTEWATRETSNPLSDLLDAAEKMKKAHGYYPNRIRTSTEEIEFNPLDPKIVADWLNKKQNKR